MERLYEESKEFYLHEGQRSDILPRNEEEALELLQKNPFVSKTAYEKFELMAHAVSNAEDFGIEKRYSHIIDIFRLQEMLKDILAKATEDEKRGEFSEEEWVLVKELSDNRELLSAGFIYQDVGKAESKIAADLYNLHKFPLQTSIGGAIKRVRTLRKQKFPAAKSSVSFAEKQSLFNYVIEALRAKITYQNASGNDTVLDSFLDQTRRNIRNQDVEEAECEEMAARLKKIIMKGDAPSFTSSSFLQKVLIHIPMRAFYDAHTYHSLSILDESKDHIMREARVLDEKTKEERRITEEEFNTIRAIVGAHHYTEGNALVPPTASSIWSELVDKLNALLTRGRDPGQNSEETWHMAKKFIEEKRISLISDPAVKKCYEQELDLLDKLHKNTWVSKENDAP